MTLIAILIAVVGTAGEVEFSLDLNNFKWTPNQDVRTKARLAHWNDPMGRMMYHFNQQQAWIMRGTMPGAERNTGVAVRMKAHRTAENQRRGACRNVARGAADRVAQPPVSASVESCQRSAISRHLVHR